MNLKELSDIEREIYWYCYELPRTIYQIIVILDRKGMGISYSNCCQKCGILIAKGFLQKIISGKKSMYVAVEMKTPQEIEEIKDETPKPTKV